MQNSYENYIAHGFDEKAALYFSQGRKRIIAVQAVDSEKLLLTFDNNEKRVYSCRHLIEEGGVFSIIADPKVFQRVYLDEYGAPAWDIDPEVDSRINWQNKIDISPDTCYIDGEALE